nr:putative reverse transcriptase domain-containing protein [Tanacetum cinerariifolium]
MALDTNYRISNNILDDGKRGLIAYMLDFPEELDGVHDTFYVLNIKKCLADPTLQVPLDEIRVDDKLNFVEEPMEIMEREFKKLKRSRTAIVKLVLKVVLLCLTKRTMNHGRLVFS